MTEVTCARCGKEFNTFRSNARFCSDDCRVRAHLSKYPRFALRAAILERDKACRRCGRDKHLVVRYHDPNTPTLSTGYVECRRCAYGKHL